MKLGYSINSFHGGVPGAAAADRVLANARVAADAGFDYVETGDHHVVHGGQYLQNVPTTARLSEQFDRVAAMALLPFYDPLLLAEQLGTVAAFAEAFDLWCALGHEDRSFEAFGVPKRERVPRFEEALELLRALWSEERVTYDGEFYGVEDVTINPKAESARVCIGGSAEPAVRRAGRLGDAWVATPMETVDDLERKLGWLRDAEEDDTDAIVRRDALVLADGDRARELADEALADGYRGWPADAEWVLAGDAEDVAAELDALSDAGADEVVVRPMQEAHAAETLREVAAAR